MLTANRPTATTPNRTDVSTARRHRLRQRCQMTIGGNMSAFDTLENVASPSTSAATMSLRGRNSHLTLGGACSGAATSLYSQQKYATTPSVKLKSSGAIHTK